MKTAFFLACFCIASFASAAPINIIQNGDFEAGNIGFASDYQFVADGLMDDDLWPAGVYGVDDTAVGRHSLWVTNGAQSGSGQFLLVNGRTDAASTVWRQDVALESGHSYTWTTWAANLCCRAGELGGIGPTLEFYLGEMLLGSFITDGPGVWESTSWGFTAASSALASLSIRNTTTLFHGNDFGLDTLSLTDDNPAVPEPASMLLLGTGLIGIGNVVRKRKARG